MASRKGGAVRASAATSAAHLQPNRRLRGLDTRLAAHLRCGDPESLSLLSEALAIGKRLKCEVACDDNKKAREDPSDRNDRQRMREPGANRRRQNSGDARCANGRDIDHAEAIGAALRRRIHEGEHGGSGRGNGELDGRRRADGAPLRQIRQEQLGRKSPRLPSAPPKRQCQRPSLRGQPWVGAAPGVWTCEGIRMRRQALNNAKPAKTAVRSDASMKPVS